MVQQVLEGKISFIRAQWFNKSWIGIGFFNLASIKSSVISIFLLQILVLFLCYFYCVGFFFNNIFSSPSWQHPVKTYGYAFFFSLTGYFGISFVLALIKLFGALVAVTGQSNIFSSAAIIWVIILWELHDFWQKFTLNGLHVSKLFEQCLRNA